MTIEWLLVKVLTGHNLLKKPADAAYDYNILVNSVSPEWSSRTTDSGINKAIAKANSDGEEHLNDALQCAKKDFMRTNNGAAPTYGDCLVTETFGVAKEDGFDAVVHVLGADCSDRPKRYPVPLFTPKGRVTRATVFAAYFRSVAAAHEIAANAKTEDGTQNNDTGLGFVQISAGVFEADQASCADMFALAMRAWVAIRGLSSLKKVIMCCGNEEEERSLMAALLRVSEMSDTVVEDEVRKVLGTEVFWLDTVPQVHTIEQKEAGQVPDDGIPAFVHPSFMEASFPRSLLLSREFLHFVPNSHSE